MLPTLREVLETPSFRAAAVKVVTGDPDTTTVRWVHSSEVYEMGGLLAGGEVLLTSGLGLHGRSAAQLTAYVDQLADAGCVALALEVGRSFFEVPAELVAAAERRGVVFLALTAVVPFERMVEDFHDLLVRRRMSTSRSGEPIWQELLGTVVAGQGMVALLDATARLAGCAVALHDEDGRLVERSRISVGALPGGPTEADVRGSGGVLGRLALQGSPSARRNAVAQRAAVAVALELARHLGPGDRPSAAQSLVADLAAGVVGSAREAAERLGSAGWTPEPGRHVLVAALDVDPRTPVGDAVPALREAVQAVVGPCVVGTAGSHAVVVAQGWTRGEPMRVRRAFEDVYARLVARDGGDVVRALGVAAPVEDLADLHDAVGRARDVVRLARRLGTRRGVVLARDVGVHRLLAAESSSALVAELVADQLGALIAYDTQHSADLVRTLDAYLATGGSKARSAAILGIRRQSLYARLARIERLLGTPLDDPAQLVTLGVAMTGWRLRTGLDPQAAFDRAGR
ncbi:PucR family transcriptional regulator [Mumia sp. DW29H23]|uniref:PucR family transcriptional regulator n=1 Tax=Mumia sp. DW29H23 TaxID=3421241 RepID=UPI003D684039